MAFEASRLASRSILPEEIFFAECGALLVLLVGSTCFTGAAGISRESRDEGAEVGVGAGEDEGTMWGCGVTDEGFANENTEAGATLLLGAAPAEKAIGGGLKAEEAFAGPAAVADEGCWILSPDPDS